LQYVAFTPYYKYKVAKQLKKSQQQPARIVHRSIVGTTMGTSRPIKLLRIG
jgi:hypothetical protein